MTTVVDPLALPFSAACDPEPVRPPRAATIALLGLGQVGSAVAQLVATAPEIGSAVRISGALVRNVVRVAPPEVFVTADARTLLDARPDVVVEVLGGREPARTLVLDALGRGIPVVTANKTLLAAHGDELLEAASDAGVPLRYEASVVAGVPFLGTFDRRPLASALTAIAGIVNGTSHFILSRMEKGCDYAAALAEAQRLGYAERDPFKDVAGIDAAEKLTILIRHFARVQVSTTDIPIAGIDSLGAADLAQARELGGAIKPVVYADLRRPAAPSAFVGPAIVPARHPLAALSGVSNGVSLQSPYASLFYSGPGAGPAVTAATILDDVAEVLAGSRDSHLWRRAAPATVSAPAEARWFVRLRSAVSLPDASDTADLLGAHDVWTSRITDTSTHAGVECRWILTLPCARPRIERALRSLEDAARCDAQYIPVLEDGDGR